jgi:hypothetical protein
VKSVHRRVEFARFSAAENRVNQGLPRFGSKKDVLIHHVDFVMSSIGPGLLRHEHLVMRVP